jgi:hypothetical protein
MTLRDDFEVAEKLMGFHKEFKEWCFAQDFDDIEVKYVIAQGLDHKQPETTKCDLIGLKYNSRSHQKFKRHREAGLLDPGIFFTVKALADKDKKPEEVKDDRTDLERLDSIISGDFRVADRLKAMELKEKLTKIYQGDIVMKPWQRIWLEHIIPNMVSHKDLQQQHD